MAKVAQLALVSQVGKFTPTTFGAAFQNPTPLEPSAPQQRNGAG
jgi:hypothetical protein